MGACVSKAEGGASNIGHAANGDQRGCKNLVEAVEQTSPPRTCLRLQPWQPHTPGLVFAHGMILDNSACSQPAVVMPTTSTQLMLTVASREDTAGALGVESDSHYLKCLLDVSMAGAGDRLTLLGSALAAMVAQGQHGDSLGVACQKPWLTRPHVKLRLHLHVLNAGASASEWVLCIDHELQGTTAIPPAIIKQPLLPLQPVSARPTPAQSTTSQDIRLDMKALLSGASAPAGLAPPVSGAPSSTPGLSSTHSHLQRSAMMVSEAPWLVTLICLQDGVILSQNDASAHYLGRQLPCISRLDTAAGTTSPCSPVAQAAGIHPAVQLLLSLLLVLEEASGEQEASQALTDIAQGRTWSKVVKVPLALAEAMEEVCGETASGAEAIGSTQDSPAEESASEPQPNPEPANSLVALLMRPTQAPSKQGTQPTEPIRGASQGLPSSRCQPAPFPLSGGSTNVGGLTSALLHAAFASVDDVRMECMWRGSMHPPSIGSMHPPSIGSVKASLANGLNRSSGPISEEPQTNTGPAAGRNGLVSWGLPTWNTPENLAARVCDARISLPGQELVTSSGSQGWETSNIWKTNSGAERSSAMSASVAPSHAASAWSGPSRGASRRILREASLGHVAAASPGSARSGGARHQAPRHTRSFGAGAQPLRQSKPGLLPAHAAHPGCSPASGGMPRVARILDTIARSQTSSLQDVASMLDACQASCDMGFDMDTYVGGDGRDLLQTSSVEDSEVLNLGLCTSLSRFGSAKAPSTLQSKGVGSKMLSHNQGAEHTQGAPDTWPLQEGHVPEDQEATAAAGVPVTAELLGEIKEQLQAGPWCWHEVFLKRVVDPATGRPALLLVQSNVSERAELEAQLAELSEAQLGLLSQIFPRYVIEQLGVNGGLTVANLAQAARTHPCATVLFMDLVGFTRLSQSMSAELIIIFINDLFGTFDLLVDKHGVQKIDCMGDCLVIGAGVLRPDDEGFNVVDYQHTPEECAARVFACAQDMIRAAAQMRLPLTGERLEIRIGIHSGTCVSGLIGLRLPKWTVLGDTVNTAARMEQTCVPGKVQVSTTTHALLSCLDEQLQPTGGVLCKGKGVMDTWIWTPPTEWENEPPLPAAFFAHASMNAPPYAVTSQDSNANGRRVQFDMGVQSTNLLGSIPETLCTTASFSRPTAATTAAAGAGRAASANGHMPTSASGCSSNLSCHAPNGCESRSSPINVVSRLPSSFDAADTASRAFLPFGASSSKSNRHSPAGENTSRAFLYGSNSALSGHHSISAAAMGGWEESAQNGGYLAVGSSSNSGPGKSGQLVKVLAQARKGWKGSAHADLGPCSSRGAAGPAGAADPRRRSTVLTGHGAQLLKAALHGSSLDDGDTEGGGERESGKAGHAAVQG